MNPTSKLVIDLKSKDLGIQGIGTVHLKFNVKNVINTLILKNALYMLLIMYNIITTEPLRAKNFSVTI